MSEREAGRVEAPHPRQETRGLSGPSPEKHNYWGWGSGSGPVLGRVLLRFGLQPQVSVVLLAPVLVFRLQLWTAWVMLGLWHWPRVTSLLLGLLLGSQKVLLELQFSPQHHPWVASALLGPQPQPQATLALLRCCLGPWGALVLGFYLGPWVALVLLGLQLWPFIASVLLELWLCAASILLDLWLWPCMASNLLGL